MRYLKILIIILLIQLVTSCMNISLNVDQSKKDNKGVTCKDYTILNLKDYTKPTIPNVDDLDEGDREGEILLLLDYIDLLRSDIETYIKDYDCTLN